MTTRNKKTVSKQVNPGFARAAVEVLEAVWLSEKNFELQHKIPRPRIVETDNKGYTWVTVKIQVPRLDVDMWQNRTHCDHPDNKTGEDT